MDKSFIIINITGKKYKCTSTETDINPYLNEFVNVNELYHEIDMNDETLYGLNIMIILLKNGDLMIVDKDCFELEDIIPKELFSIPITMN